jgi:hypothetical protein
MAKKEPETIDRYRIFAETSMEQMGFVLAAMTKMGLQNISYELITDVNRFKTKERKVHEVSAEEFAAAFVKENARFKSSDLVAHFKAAGREPSSAYYGLKKLTDANVVRKSVGGEFVRVEALAPPKSPPDKHAAADAPRKTFEMTGKDAIWRHVKNRKGFTTKELGVLFRAQGRQEKSVSPLLTALAAEKKIKNVGEGSYVVLKPKPKPTVKKRPPPPPAEASAPAAPLMNGAAAHG